MPEILEQAGIYKLTLFENDNAVLVYNDSSGTDIVRIDTDGQIITIEYCDTPTFKREVINSSNYSTSFIDTIAFALKNFNNTTNNLIDTLKDSRFGWIVKMEFLKGEIVVLPTPMYIAGSVIKERNESVWR